MDKTAVFNGCTVEKPQLYSKGREDGSMKIACLFAGQGAQYPGMGSDLYEKYEKSREVFDAAGEKIKNLCFNGTAEELKLTENTQPCVYTVTMAAYEEFISRFEEKKPQDAKIAAMAGFSLGEYAALTAAGVIPDIETGVEMMEHRGRYMGEAGRNEAGENIGTMAAAIGDRAKVLECVEKAREDGILVAANINAPTQTVVSGDRDAVARFAQIAKEARLRVTPLAVGSAFHSPMMSPASEKMRSLILTKDITPSDFPVYSNLTARPISEYRKGSAFEGAPQSDPSDNSADSASSALPPQTAEDIADAMALQLMSPVQWVSTIENLKAAGIDTVIEFGPGKTLCGLVKKIDKTIKTYNVENAESLESTLEAICSAE